MRTKILAVILCAILLLSGCANKESLKESDAVLPENDTQIDDTPENYEEDILYCGPEDPDVELPDGATQVATGAYCGNGYANMMLIIPLSWEYETFGILPEASDDVITEEPPFGIYFWPKEDPDAMYAVSYYPAPFGFGVCGTGLSEETITLENGSHINVGRYDGDSSWSFIVYNDAPGSYAATKHCSNELSEKYGDEAYEIASSAILGTGVITRPEAEEIAKPHCEIEYEYITSRFDHTLGYFDVTFYSVSEFEEVQVITVDSGGNLVEIHQPTVWE